jgi:tetratricopeptide (TPR) repeat protein
MSNVSEVATLAARAGQAASQARWAEAEALWRRVLELDPANGEAHFSVGMHHAQRNEFAPAAQHFAAARAAAPGQAAFAYMQAQAAKVLGDAEQEWDAINAALAADPYF